MGFCVFAQNNFTPKTVRKLAHFNNKTTTHHHKTQNTNKNIKTKQTQNTFKYIKHNKTKHKTHNRNKKHATHNTTKQTPNNTNTTQKKHYITKEKPTKLINTYTNTPNLQKLDPTKTTPKTKKQPTYPPQPLPKPHTYNITTKHDPTKNQQKTPK